MYKLLRSSCSWCQISYISTKCFSEKSSFKQFCTLRKNIKALRTESHWQNRGQQSSNLKYLEKVQAIQFLPLYRLYGNGQNQDEQANSVSDQRQTPIVGATISKRRLEWQASFREILMSKDTSDWTSSDWEAVAAKMSLPRAPRWDVLCMHTLYQDKNLALGKSLIRHLEEKGEPLSHTLLTFFIGLLGETSTSPEQDDETKLVYDRLLQTSEFLDAASIEVLASGLSHTKYYMECFRLIEMFKETSTVGSSVLVSTLFGSIRFKDMELLKSTLSIVEDLMEPTNLANFSAKLIELCLSSTDEIFVAVMDFYKRHSLMIPFKQAEDIIEAFHRLQPNKWRIQTSYIHHRTGRCVNCQYQMEDIAISRADFEEIQKAFLDQVIVASNIFYKTTPDEVKNFVKFVERTGPYDVVIDGLNVLNKQKRPIQADVLDKTVEHFQSQGKRVLLLGSKILVRFISNIKRLKPKPSIYMTNTTKADDSFFLYAALQSGKDTLIVSKDKLRDHKFLMDPKLRPLFQQWLKKAQISDWFFSRYGEFTIGRRHLYSIGPHRDKGGWHLPLNDIDKQHPFGNFTVLCVRDTSIVTTQSTPGRTRNPSHEGKKPRIYYGQKGKSKNPKPIDLKELMESE